MSHLLPTLISAGLALLPLLTLHAQNVGIGTAAPAEKLHIAGSLRVDALAGTGTRLVGADPNGTLQIITAGTAGQVLTQTGAGPAWQNGADWAILGNAGTNPATHFAGTIDAADFVLRTANAERMRILAGGNVGINLNTPVSRLHVNGDIRIGPLLPINTGTLPSFGNQLIFSGGNTGPNYNSDNSDPAWMARYNAASDQSEIRMNLSDNCQGADAFVIQTGGSGCGANTVYFRFDGIGDAYRPGGGSWLALSDRRLKKEIAAYATGLETLRHVNPVTYQYNGQASTPDDGRTYVGVIAQELQTVAPDMVRQTGQHLTVDPSAFTYMLINAVKAQDAEIQALKAQQAAMQAQIDRLEQHAPR